MLKNIMAIAAVSGLALTSALAQSTSPSTTAPSSSNTPSATAPSTSSSMAAATTSGKATFINQQTSDQFLASKFRGTNVIGADDTKIGDVSDILFDKDQKILAYVVGVGGFLGIGAKDVAIAPASFQPVPGKDATDTKLRLSMTKDELKAAQAFEPYKPPRPVSSDASPTRPMGAPAPGGTTGSIK